MASGAVHIYHAWWVEVETRQSGWQRLIGEGTYARAREVFDQALEAQEDGDSGGLRLMKQRYLDGIRTGPPVLEEQWNVQESQVIEALTYVDLEVLLRGNNLSAAWSHGKYEVKAVPRFNPCGPIMSASSRSLARAMHEIIREVARLRVASYGGGDDVDSEGCESVPSAAVGARGCDDLEDDVCSD